MTAPNFIIVGAMKAGTTSLFADLGLLQDVYLSSPKEPETLIRHASTRDCLRDYADIFRAAPPEAILGEASTAYTKRPLVDGVAAQALNVCGAGLRVIYLTRDPVARVVSHYRHDVSLGGQLLPLEEAVRTDSRYIDYSRYDWQIEPWRDRFEHVLELRFEDFITDRDAVLARVASFIGSPGLRGPAPVSIKNASDDRRVVSWGPARRLMLSHAYQRRLRRHIPSAVHATARRLLVRRAKVPNAIVSPEVREYVLDELARPHRG